MQTVARLAKTAAGRSAPAVAAGAAAVAGSSGTTSHADCRVVPASAPNVQLPRKIKDDWELADFDKGRVLFEPADIDDATSSLRSAYVTTSPEALDDLETDTTEGSAADEIIELSTATRLQPFGEQPAWQEYDLAEVFQVANRLLKAPGVQQEMIKAALADPEVFSILNAKADLAGYLESTGFAPRGLIGPAEASDSSRIGTGTALTVVPKDTTGAPAAAEGGFWASVAVGIAGEVEELGKGLLRVSRWLKSKVGLTGQSTGDKTEDGEQVGEDDEAESARKVGGRFMQLVGVAMLAIVMVVIVRKPGVFGRLFRRRF